MAEKKQQQPGKPTGQRIRTGVFVALMVFFCVDGVRAAQPGGETRH